MDILTKRPVTQHTSEIISESGLGRLLQVYQQYGYGSQELKQEEIDYQLESAIDEANYQAIRARNRLIWDV